MNRARLLTTAVVYRCALFSVCWAIYPFTRSAFRLQVGYNEGWNVYTAQRLVNHLQLYPQDYGWQTVNYPMLSFALIAFLHRFTHDYLFTARLVSLLSLVACCVLCGVVVRQFAASRQAAFLSAFFCLGVFCTDADLYVGMDDPQLLAQVFFVGGLALYLRDRQSWKIAALVAALFVLAGSIKHNAIEFPLAVLLDITILSWRRVLWFAACGTVFAALAIALNLYFGGPYFLTQLLASRAYSFSHGFHAVTLGVLLPLIAPLAVTIAFAWTQRHDPARRVLVFLLTLSLIIGTLFAGGSGVSTNTYFSAILALSMTFGLFLSDLEHFASNYSSPKGSNYPSLKEEDPLVAYQDTNLQATKNPEKKDNPSRRFLDSSTLLSLAAGAGWLQWCNQPGKPAALTSRTAASL